MGLVSLMGGQRESVSHCLSISYRSVLFCYSVFSALSLDPPSLADSPGKVTVNSRYVCHALCLSLCINISVLCICLFGSLSGVARTCQLGRPGIMWVG